MKTAWGNPVHIISFIRTLLIMLAVTVCTVAADDLQTLRKKAEAGDVVAQNNLGVMYRRGNKPEKDASPAAEASPAADVSPATYLQTPVTFFFPV